MNTTIKYSFTDPLGNPATQSDTFNDMEIDECIDLLSKKYLDNLVIISAEYV